VKSSTSKCQCYRDSTFCQKQKVIRAAKSGEPSVANDRTDAKDPTDTAIVFSHPRFNNDGVYASLWDIADELEYDDDTVLDDDEN